MADPADTGNRTPPYETRDIDLGLVGLGFAAFAAAVVLPLVLMTLIFSILWPGSDMTREERQVSRPTEVTQAPELQVSPGADLALFRERVEQRLGSAGWVNRMEGTVHIPIEDAMKLHLQRTGGEDRP